MHIAMTHTRLRAEERMLIDAFEETGARLTPVDLREIVFDPESLGRWDAFDAVLDRSLSLTSTLASVRVLESLGVRCINPLRAIETCADKLATTLALVNAGIPTPRVRVGLGEGSGLEAIEALGYPCVLKPTVGSWGRLVSRVNDRDAAEALLEHRAVLGSVGHSVVYAQEHIAKPGRDLRVFVVGGRGVAAIARRSEHWLTNTARGAVAAGIGITPEMASLSERSVAAVGADIGAVDLLECPRRGLLVNELNHSMEFRNSTATTGVDIHRLVARHAVEIARDHRHAQRHEPERDAGSAGTPYGEGVPA